MQQCSANPLPNPSHALSPGLLCRISALLVHPDLHRTHPIYVTTASHPIYVTTAAHPIYVTTASHPIYVTTAAHPIYVTTAAHPIYVSTAAHLVRSQGLSPIAGAHPKIAVHSCVLSDVHLVRSQGLGLIAWTSPELAVHACASSNAHLVRRRVHGAPQHQVHHPGPPFAPLLGLLAALAWPQSFTCTCLSRSSRTVYAVAVTQWPH